MRAVIIGYGKMGQLIEKKLQETENMECVGIVHRIEESKVSNLEELLCRLEDQGRSPHVLIDFSHPENLSKILECLRQRPAALVLGTTGYRAEQICQIYEATERIPVLYTANFSLGVTIMKRVVAEIRAALGDDYDIEIVEKHHNEKLDSPSGTAKMLVEAIDPGQRLERVYGREGHSKRGKEIGIHVVRGGTIAGEHTVIFAGEDEILEVTHRATSRQIFANGAIRGAEFVAGRKPGLYTVDDVIGNGVCT